MFRPLTTTFRSTKVRFKARSVNRIQRRVTLGVNQLDDRIMPTSATTINYFAFTNGVYTYNHLNGQVRQIAPYQATALAGAGGSLYAGFSFGTYSYDYTANHWTPVLSL